MKLFVKCVCIVLSLFITILLDKFVFLNMSEALYAAFGFVSCVLWNADKK